MKNKYFKILLFITFIILAFLQNSYSETSVSGNITSNTTWTLAGSPYIVTGDITVPEGITLTIEAGTVIKFTANSDDVHGGNDTNRAELIINGSIIAAGTVTNKIQFKSNASVPANGNWGGIRINCNNNSKQFQMDYCIIQHATNGVYLYSNSGNNSLKLNNCEVNNNSSNGIYTYAENSSNFNVEINSNVIYQNSNYGIYNNTNINLTIKNCTISNNNNNGINAYYNNNLT
ncbi:MAG: hypothetical protein ACD_79C00248G0001, partial [uncultured bacterium]